MKIKNVIYKDEYIGEPCADELEFDTISFSAKDVGERSLYFHIKRVSFNSDSAIESVLSQRPVAIVTDESANIHSDDVPVIGVKNARRALSFAYARFYGIDFTRLKLIGITGTNGKTTTACMLENILSEEGKKTGFIGTGRIVSDGRSLSDEYYSMTTPDPDVLYSSLKRMENDGCEYVIMEVSSHSLALEKVAPLYFEVAVFTNLSHEHLDFHGSVDEYYKTKIRLFDQCKHALFNIDDPYGRRAYSECRSSKEGFGILFDADVRAREPKLLGFEGSSFIYRAKNFLFKMHLPLVGAYNIYNALAAVCAATALGVKPCVARRALQKMKPPAGRFETYRDRITVITDYAHTPEAFENILKTIISCKNQWQKLITVFGCGGDRDKTKRPLMGKIAERLSDAVVITEDNSRSESKEDIANDILRGVEDKSKTALILSRKEAIESAIMTADDGDIIAILGKGAERYNIGKNGISPFDERIIIEDALRKRNGDKGA